MAASNPRLLEVHWQELAAKAFPGIQLGTDLSKDINLISVVNVDGDGDSSSDANYGTLHCWCCCWCCWLWYFVLLFVFVLVLKIRSSQFLHLLLTATVCFW